MTIRGRLAVRCLVARSEIGAVSGGRLVIGDRVFINQGVSLVANEFIEIGDNVRIGDFAAVYDCNFHAVDEDKPVRSAPVILEANVWLRRGAIILPGTTIGAHSVVAAASVVQGEIPPRVLVAGNPAEVVREIRASENWRRS